MNRIIRQRRLGPEGAARYDRVREGVAEELPELIARHHERAGDGRPSGVADGRATIPAVSVNFAGGDRPAAAVDAMGMRPMQAKVWQRRGEQYLLIKSPPASGKSRALMFVALDKLANQGLRQAVIVVPERSIGASFADEPLTRGGFFADWHVEPRWNLCDAPGGDDGGKVEAVRRFLESGDAALVCTHATFRFAMDKLGAAAFDDRLVAVDEFHHVSTSGDSRLGDHVRQLIERGKAHLVAMTGSYFRGDAAAVLHPEDEARFETVTYTYYEQLNGYQYLKHLDIGYYFYTGEYADAVGRVLDPAQKTIVHIPSVNARESMKDKGKEVEHILGELGEWVGVDPATGFQLVKTPGGRVLRVADLVDDEPVRRERVAAALRDPAHKHDRDHVDVIIALGMAKEGFDWVWCEHALTIGYRSSLTEIVQIIGRATRDAPGKIRARFTNLIAEPDAAEGAVAEAVNDTLKAIAASLLMEQVLAPRFEFRPKSPANTATPGLDYGPGGYDPNGTNVGVDPQTGTIQLEIKGLAEPKSPEAGRICREDLNELVTAFVQDAKTVEKGMFDAEAVPEELTQVRMGKIVRERFPALDEADQESVRQHAVAALNLVQQAKRWNADVPVGSGEGRADGDVGVPGGDGADEDIGVPNSANTALIDGVRRYAMSVTELDVDLIDRINPFGEAYAILAKSMSEERLRAVAEVIAARRVSLSADEARALATRAKRFLAERGRLPSLTAGDPWEKQMAEGVAYLQRMAREAARG